MYPEQHLGIWGPPNEQALPGNLILDESGAIKLQLLHSGEAILVEHYEMMYGVTGKDLYTLLGVLQHSMNFSMATTIGATFSYYVRSVIKGAHLDSYDHRFPRFSFSIVGLQEWTRLTGISSEIIQVGDDSSWTRQFAHKRPPAVDIAIDGYNYRFFSQSRTSSKNWAIDLEEDSQVHVSSQEPLTIGEWLSRVVRPFQRLVQMSVKTGGNLQRLAVSDKLEGGNGSERDWFELVNFTSDQYPYVTDRFRLEHPILQLEDIQRSPESLEKWFEVDAKYREALAAVIDTTLGEPTEGYVLFAHSRFLERLVSRYAQSELCDKDTMKKIVEYAKGLVPGDNGETLGQKIGSQRRNDAKVPLIGALRKWIPFFEGWQFNEAEIGWIATKIIKTRNHFAHQGADKPDPMRIQHGEEVVFLALIRTIIDFEIADLIGINAEIVAKRLEDTLQWRNSQLVHEVWNDYQV